MYPNTFISLFPPFPRTNKVFVAMSFDKRFVPRWENVIQPAVARVAIGTDRLEAERVDARKVSDSILTEILAGVSQARVVFADITTLNVLDGVPIRNGNVLYEVGIAHAVRLPEEVILFRSDGDRLLFDMSNVRVNDYEPDTNPAAAQTKVADAIFNAIKEVDLRRHLTIKRGLDSLDFSSWHFLIQAASAPLTVQPMRTMGQAVGLIERASAIRRLLELGMLQTQFMTLTPETLARPLEDLITYAITPFGQTIIQSWTEKTNFHSPEVTAALSAIKPIAQSPSISAAPTPSP